MTAELSVKARARGYSEGQAIGGLVYNLLFGGTGLSDLAGLWGDGGTQEVLGVESILAPTTAGECLRKFALGACTPPSLPRFFDLTWSLLEKATLGLRCYLQDR